ncbi:arginine/ornithine antiporter ArcD [Photobacterium aphoticum]|uniref:Arginine/ornithine antiporter ArcD n=1 Tax=Photobacterium aphoticum TaxID=754436 RepID=A0A090R6L8_9GAMM|nr:arginine/ornithine antiporter ArcD [Photobacterium aphoticum]
MQQTLYRAYLAYYRFITGIYDTLLESIRRVNPSLIGIWRREGFKAAFAISMAPS